jgi:DNA-binding MurR/RpiR family transcriptional regulator
VIDDSATILAQRAGVSRATAARLFQRLGYPSFKAAQQSLEKQHTGLGPTSQAHVNGVRRPEARRQVAPCATLPGDEPQGIR